MQRIRPAVFRKDALEVLDACAEKMGKKAVVHVKVDTGMSRIGIRPDEEGLFFMEWLFGLKHIEVEGIFTHFARADEADQTPALAQLEQFTAFVAEADAWTIETWDASILCIGRYFEGDKIIGIFNFSEFDKTAWIKEDDGIYPACVMEREPETLHAVLSGYGQASAQCLPVFRPPDRNACHKRKQQ